MKMIFLSDFGEFKQGQVVDLPEEVADDLHQAGRACPYVEMAVEDLLPKDEPKEAPKKRK